MGVPEAPEQAFNLCNTWLLVKNNTRSESLSGLSPTAVPAVFVHLRRGFVEAIPESLSDESETSECVCAGS